ncbi:DUF397 domain-containing protein [Actinomadura fibrosa]|uniref:DUF397 domain-containing protein n=1 Tax=Actinomadura fibrosa TaxID=111802 RepID=A0ABW2XQU6_9ACTN|nr:DUF397 domain-containing protein [Actinomadura fibrosa]
MSVRWHKSSHSGGVDDKACVELGRLSVGVGVRDSKDPEGGQLSLTAGEFASLVRKIKGRVER